MILTRQPIRCHVYIVELWTSEGRGTHAKCRPTIGCKWKGCLGKWSTYCIFLGFSWLLWSPYVISSQLLGFSSSSNWNLSVSQFILSIVCRTPLGVLTPKSILELGVFIIWVQMAPYFLKVKYHILEMYITKTYYLCSLVTIQKSRKRNTWFIRNNSKKKKRMLLKHCLAHKVAYTWKYSLPTG